MSVENIKCPICYSDGAKLLKDGGDSTWECLRCGGPFTLTVRARSRTYNAEESAKVALALRQMRNREEVPYVDVSLIDAIIQNAHIPTPREQLDNFILWLGKSAGSDFGIRQNVHPYTAAGVMGSISPDSARNLLSSYQNEGLLQFDLYGKEIVWLTAKGWDRFFELQHTSVESHLAFMAMRFSPDLDENYRKYWKPAVAQTGFNLETVIENQGAGVIDNQIRVKIRRSRFLLVEMTHSNQNAYWEAGFGEGLGRPVIYLCEKGYFDDPKTKPTFNVSHSRHVLWEQDKLDSACRELIAAIRVELPAEAKQED
ncbi:MAG: hypothetical protein HY423_14220 [Candidatus Lambdaproteobacteria bacterium]|nr:hypothetical protein [Candidatus Lambdaproteobacteria bacterium]